MEKATDLRTYEFAAQDLGESYYRRSRVGKAEATFRTALNSKKERTLLDTEDRIAGLDDLLYTRIVWARQLRIRKECVARHAQLDEAQALVRQ
jgi:hypothetical protein